MIERLPLFVGTTLLMLVAPGPDFVLVTRNAVAGGRRRAALTATGICGGMAALTLLTASGIAAVIAANPTLLLILRVLGGAYLLVLGGLMLLSARRQRQPDEASLQSTRSPVGQGFLNNLLNPKALIFSLTFMPQFLVTPGPPVFVQTLALGSLVIACGATWWALYIAAIGRLRNAMTRGSVRTAIDVGAGVALGGLGALSLLGGV